MNDFTDSIINEIATNGIDIVFGHHISDQDRSLSFTFCSSDTYDFIALDDLAEAWLFSHNEITNTWETTYLGSPEYQIDSEMLGDSDINLHGFCSELQSLLPGVYVKPITSSCNGAKNQSSLFWQQFQETLEKYFNQALEAF